MPRSLHTRPSTPHGRAIQAVMGDPGRTALLVVVVAAGIGALVDFQVIRLHPIFSVGLSLGSVPLAVVIMVRRTLRMDQQQPNPDYLRNLALAAVAGQSGCVTVILIFGGLFAGMFVDARLETHPIFTLVLLFAAVPLSLYIMIRMLLSSVGAIYHPPPRGESGTAGEPSTLAKEKDS